MDCIGRERAEENPYIWVRHPENIFFTESFSEIADTCHTKPVGVNEIPVGFNI